MHSSEQGPGELAERVGRLVKAHRRAQGITQGAMASQTGLSRTILARIERGEGNPSIGTLWKVSRALRVPLGELLAEQAEPRTRVVRAGEGDAMDDPSGMVGRLLHADGRERRTELYALELPRRRHRDAPPHLPGVEELLVVTRGRARLGPLAAPEELGPGDALWFAADVEHGYATLGDAACHLLCWMVYPPAGAA